MPIFPAPTDCPLYYSFRRVFQQTARQKPKQIEVKLLKAHPLLTKVFAPRLCLHFSRLCGKQEGVKFVGRGNFAAPPNTEAASIGHLSMFHWVMNPFTCWSGKIIGCGGKLGLARLGTQLSPFQVLPPQTVGRTASCIPGGTSVVAKETPQSMPAIPWCGQALRRPLYTQDGY